MTLLALDTTGSVAGAALVTNEKVLAEINLDVGKTHSQTIMPMVANLLDMTGLSLEQLNYIACSSGPGSFTGLRIGAATAKALAHGADKKIIPVSTLDAMAYNVYDASKLVVPIMDARRERVYTCFYRLEDGVMRRLTEPMAKEMNTVIEMLTMYNLPVIFTGDGLVPYSDQIIKSGFEMAPAHLNRQRAAALGYLAIKLAETENAVNHADFSPVYLRKPQAEREYENAHS